MTNLLTKLINQHDEWGRTIDKLYQFVKLAKSIIPEIKNTLKSLPPAMPGYNHIYWNPETKIVYISLGDSDPQELVDKWSQQLKKIDGVKSVITECSETPPKGWKDKSEPWIRVEKNASNALHTIAQGLNYLPSPVNKFFGGPSPLAAALTSALVGGGLGYGAGALLENVLPESVINKGRLRKTLALLGGGLATIPASFWGLVNYQAHPEYQGSLKSLISGWPVREQDELEFAKTSCNLIHEATTSLKELLPESKTALSLIKFAQDEDDDPDTGINALATMPIIPKDNFNNVVWADPFTPQPIRAATSGLVESASMSQGGVRWVSPLDVGKIAIGMGSGLVSGMIVGKTLGALAGLTPQAQKSLQNAGTWAGILTNIVPLAFGR